MVLSPRLTDICFLPASLSPCTFHLPATGRGIASSWLLTGSSPKPLIKYIELRPVILRAWLPLLLAVTFQSPGLGFLTEIIFAPSRFNSFLSPFASVNRLPNKKKKSDTVGKYDYSSDESHHIFSVLGKEKRPL